MLSSRSKKATKVWFSFYGFLDLIYWLTVTERFWFHGCFAIFLISCFVEPPMVQVRSMYAVCRNHEATTHNQLLHGVGAGLKLHRVGSMHVPVPWEFPINMNKSGKRQNTHEIRIFLSLSAKMWDQEVQKKKNVPLLISYFSNLTKQHYNHNWYAVSSYNVVEKWNGCFSTLTYRFTDVGLQCRFLEFLISRLTDSSYAR